MEVEEDNPGRAAPDPPAKHHPGEHEEEVQPETAGASDKAAK